MTGTVSNSIRAAYGIGDYAICLYWSGVSVILLYFYTDVVGISFLLQQELYMVIRHDCGMQLQTLLWDF